MKNNIPLRILGLLIIFSLITLEIFGQQTGKIAGNVTDKKTGETLIGLTVKINNTTNGASTDVNGHYVLGNLAPGKYSVTYSYVGYQSKSITDIEVAPGQTTSLDIIMSEAPSNALAEVVVTASAKKESLNALYSQQKNSARISDGISAESIRKSPDKNTAEVLKRVSGVTVQDNKFVIVRGLSDRYNTASLDNGALPSTEPNRKAFSFDVVPSNMVDNIIITKTATPDMAGDFAGGSVQILTKDIPDQNFVSIGLGYGYNSQSTFKDFKGSQKGASDYLGFNNTTQLPENFPSTNNVAAGLESSQNVAATNSLAKDFVVYKNQAFLGQNYQATVGRVKNFKKSENRLGAIVSLSYRNSQTSSPDQVRNFHVYNYQDDVYKFSTNLGALANFAYFFGNSKITLKNIYNRIQDDQYLYREGSNSATVSDNRFYAFDLIQKSLFKTTLDGEHKLGDSKAKLKWTIAYSDVINNQPDQRKVGYSKNAGENVEYSANVTSIGKENTRLFSDLSENIYSADVNYSLPLLIAKKTALFKAGATSQYRKRIFDVRFIGLSLSQSDPELNAVRERQLGNLFGSDLIGQNRYRLDEINNSADRYNANSFTNSAYLMLDNKLTDKIRLVWGLRAEQFQMNLKSFDPNQPTVDRNQLDLLPSANFTYSLNEKSNLRASYYRTIARPEFRELAPFAYYDYEQLAIQFGNPTLKRTSINNADLRYEIYPSAGQIISASVFYKNFTNAIESSIYDINSTPDITYFNANKANTYGVEFEFRKTLEFIGSSPALKNTTVYTNISLIKSKVESKDISGQPQNRPMVGQSPYVINAGLQHSAFDKKLSISLLYNRIGRRIYRVGGTVFPNVWEDPRDVLDFQVGLKVIKSKGEIKLNAGDLLNQKSVFYFDKDLNKKYTSKDESIGRYRPGTNVSVAFNYSF